MPLEITELCQRLADSAAELDYNSSWPTQQLAWCTEAGVFSWFVPTEFGGAGWNELQIL